MTAYVCHGFEEANTSYDKKKKNLQYMCSEAILVNISQKYNTTMPSSAATEIIFTKQRHQQGQKNQLANETFDRLIFMEGNYTDAAISSHKQTERKKNIFLTQRKKEERKKIFFSHLSPIYSTISGSNIIGAANKRI